MKVKDINRSERDFAYEGKFGPTIPIIEPKTLLNVKVNRDSNPAVLLVITRIEGAYDSNMLRYETEENIELDPEGKQLNAKELLVEVIKAGNRCFDDAYKACINQSLPFPFARTHPTFDMEKALSEIEKGLS